VFPPRRGQGAAGRGAAGSPLGPTRAGRKLKEEQVGGRITSLFPKPVGNPRVGGRLKLADGSGYALPSVSRQVGG